MGTKIKKYTRFGGIRRISLHAGRYSLWLAEDHMVQVTRYAYTEEYRRFYYQDIEAVLVRRTDGQIIRCLVWGILGLILLMMGLVGSQGSMRVLAFMGLAVVTVFFVVNLWRGDTCACHVRTAVQTERLFSISRVAQAENLIARIKFKLPGSDDSSANGK